jgi:methyl coenzyme M reductase subunit D
MAPHRIYRLRVIDRSHVEAATSPKQITIDPGRGRPPEVLSEEYVVVKREGGKWETHEFVVTTR